MTVSFGGPGAVNLGATTYLGADVSLNNTGSFFSGPNTGSLPPGTYLLSAKAQVVDSAGAADFVIQIHDGSAAVDTGRVSTSNATLIATVGLSKVVTIATATTFTLQAKDVSSTSGTLQRSTTGATTANLASSITYVRLY